ncbi:hypothetical protein KC660_01895 [Candidatus Dojkabacteria bacterium]|uniref:Uncharacterized protein n=1 Tax=Candidatus Dojkabacteria bacterium TaxID=2099670 RepID=A0A955RIB0_9BACT|nr:hypothetical protein [Candidatus Dojkabacteria bacterium]
MPFITVDSFPGNHNLSSTIIGLSGDVGAYQRFGSDHMANAILSLQRREANGYKDETIGIPITGEGHPIYNDSRYDKYNYVWQGTLFSLGLSATGIPLKVRAKLIYK